MNKFFLWMNRRAFRLSYDTTSYKTMFRTTYQYDIHIIISHKNVLYDDLFFFQSGGWICAVNVKTGHCALCSRDLIWPLPVLPRWSCQDPPRYTNLAFSWHSHWGGGGGKGLVRDDSRSKRWFNHCLTIQHFFRHRSVCKVHVTVFSSYSHTSLVQNVVSYDNVNTWPV